MILLTKSDIQQAKVTLMELALIEDPDSLIVDWIEELSESIAFYEALNTNVFGEV